MPNDELLKLLTILFARAPPHTIQIRISHRHAAHYRFPLWQGQHFRVDGVVRRVCFLPNTRRDEARRDEASVMGVQLKGSGSGHDRAQSKRNRRTWTQASKPLARAAKSKLMTKNPQSR